MSGPVIVEGFASIATVPLILAAVIALLFWRTVVPRQLRGCKLHLKRDQNDTKFTL